MYKALAENGHELHYIACERFPIHHENIFYHPLKIPFSQREGWLFWFFFFLKAPIECFLVARKVCPERIAVFGSWYAVFAVLPRIVYNIKTILFLRADNAAIYQMEKRSMLAKAINYSFQYLGLIASHQIVVNIGLVQKNVTDRYRLCFDKFALLYNNIEKISDVDAKERRKYRDFWKIEEDKIAFVTSGIFYKRKNIDFLIRAFAMADINDAAKLVIIGDDRDQGNQKKDLVKLAEALNLSDSAVFTGWREDSQQIIAACDLYVLPTLHEGFPNSLLDAMSASCACIGSDIEEIREILVYDELLFSIDHPKALADVLKRFVKDLNYRKNIQMMSRSRAEVFVFDWDEKICSLVTEESVQ